MSTVRARLKYRTEQANISLVTQVDTLRRSTNKTLDENRRGEMGQFMTPALVAKIMASMFDDLSGDIHLLDAGAGVGSLTAAFAEEAYNRSQSPRSITINAYESEPILAKQLAQSMALCKEAYAREGIVFTSNIFQQDFIEQATNILTGDLFTDRIQPRFNRVIINPPYRKIQSSSQERTRLRSVGIETSNLYTAFVSLAIKLLEDDGELVAITPRSFCNGPYFKPFRKLLLDTMSLKQIHIFHARNKAFKEDAVLQENIIFHAVKTKTTNQIIISSNSCAEDTNIVQRIVHPKEVVSPDDPDRVIHIPITKEESSIALKARSLPCSLNDLGIDVSTGRVVDFRARDYIQDTPSNTTAPLIYPCHFEQGFINWPKLNGRKPNAIIDSVDTNNLLIPSRTYVLVKRFSSKEECRRVVAAVYDPQRVHSERVGFENHLNYYHIHGNGVAKNVAKGLMLFLNSSLVDQYFRQFSGHTQVNAADLRSLRYPTYEQLKKIGNRVKNKMPDQERIDTIIESVLFS